MNKLHAVLVTGCAGDIGLGLGRILKRHGIAEKVYGCDIHLDHPGLAFFDDCFVGERADSPQYLECLQKLVEIHQIAAVIPSSEPELRFLCQQNQLDQIAGVPLITANRKSMLVGFDKLKTTEFLSAHELDYPWTWPAAEKPPREIPCIIKSRFGAGGREVHVIREEQKIADYQGRSHDYIWQEYLEPDHEEYTCALFTAKLGETRILIMKRELHGDCTGKGEVIENQEIEKLLRDMAQHLELSGAINVQLRLTQRGPIVFEINPRFSSTIVFRHQLGFQDVIWSLEDCFEGQVSDYVAPARGSKFYRTYHEVIVLPV